MTIHRQPNHRDIGRPVEFSDDEIHWVEKTYSGYLKASDKDTKPCRSMDGHWYRFARIPIDVMDSTAQLAVAADYLNDAGIDLPAEVLRRIGDKPVSDWRGLYNLLRDILDETHHSDSAER